MQEQTTKELIEQTALDLFSQKGYKAVSIREIARIVGIKESSIYYHYLNKQAIMNSLLERIDAIVENMKLNFNAEFSKANEIPEEAMGMVAVGILQNYLMNPYVFKMISILTIERMSDEKAYETYQKIVFDLPLKQQETVFREMMQRGFIKEQNAYILAQEYYSIIYLAFQKNCMGCQTSQEKIEQAIQEIKDNIIDIYRKMK